MNTNYGHMKDGSLIDPGPEHELVGEDEQLQHGDEATFDGATWEAIALSGTFTPRMIVMADAESSRPLLAIRRRKVVKEQPSSPAWIPVSECDLYHNEPFWGKSDHIFCCPDGVRCNECFDSVKEWLENLSCTHFMRCEGIYQVPPPPKPKTQQEKDEEAFHKWFNDDSFHHQHGPRPAWHAALAYARGEKDSK